MPCAWIPPCRSCCLARRMGSSRGRAVMPESMVSLALLELPHVWSPELGVAATQARMTQTGEGDLEADSLGPRTHLSTHPALQTTLSCSRHTPAHNNLLRGRRRRREIEIVLDRPCPIAADAKSHDLREKGKFMKTIKYDEDGREGGGGSDHPMRPKQRRRKQN